MTQSGNGFFTSDGKDLEQEILKKRISDEQKKKIYGNISFTSSIKDCRAPFVIEAIIEKWEAKSGLFREMAGFNSEETIFATNTSSLSVTVIAEQTPFPERIIGLHFFNPASRMKPWKLSGQNMFRNKTVKYNSIRIETGENNCDLRDAPRLL
jgi:3-hydroxybutyryl-CoA dehydrogenase